MDDLQLSNEALRQNLDELETINTWLGGYNVVLKTLLFLQPKLAQLPRPVTVADLGCGGGDTLRQMTRWFRKQNLKASLTGIDANNFMLEYAAPKAQHFPEITFQQHDIFSEAFKQQRYDVLVCSLFCHHFSDEQLVELLKQIYAQANVAVIINDLHRHPLAYYSIKGLTQVFSKSYLVKNDAPLSVLRAFRRKELEAILAVAGIANYRLKWQWAFRWQLVLLK
ncbi:methyltransferase domain-containing protein [Adhaeribacter sp. BT258]|uniref:Methyltransferase domain-containing protein n=2 Tax=Adhaeribacter terrigena TaxID=2793070 RepID=A0ABS1C3Z6_9BACT|nr:methyltransferase domain-containing protein [Adhaeribacter terrigena]